MFKLAPKTEPFNWDVLIPEVNENGTIIKHRIKGKFKRMSRSAFDQLVVACERDQQSRIGENADIPIEQQLDNLVERAMTYMLGWQDVKGPDDQPLEFSADNLRMLFDAYPGASNAVQAAFFTAWHGGEGARKN